VWIANKPIIIRRKTIEGEQMDMSCGLKVRLKNNTTEKFPYLSNVLHVHEVYFCGCMSKKWKLPYKVAGLLKLNICC